MCALLSGLYNGVIMKGGGEGRGGGGLAKAGKNVSLTRFSAGLAW